MGKLLVRYRWKLFLLLETFQWSADEFPFWWLGLYKVCSPPSSFESFVAHLVLHIGFSAPTIDAECPRRWRWVCMAVVWCRSCQSRFERTGGRLMTCSALNGCRDVESPKWWHLTKRHVWSSMTEQCLQLCWRFQWCSSDNDLGFRSCKYSLRVLLHVGRGTGSQGCPLQFRQRKCHYLKLKIRSQLIFYGHFIQTLWTDLWARK